MEEYPLAIIIIRSIQVLLSLISVLWSLSTLGLLTCPVSARCCFRREKSGLFIRYKYGNAHGIPGLSDHPPSRSMECCADENCCSTDGCFCYSVRTRWRMRRMNRYPNAAITTLAEIFLSSFFFLLWRSYTFIHALLLSEPYAIDENDVIHYSDTFDIVNSNGTVVWSPYTITSAVLVPLSTIFASVALLNASLMWYEISSGSSNKSGLKSKAIKNLSTASRTLYFVIVYVSLMVLLFIVFGSIAATVIHSNEDMFMLLGWMSIGLIPFVVAVMAVFIYCGVGLVKTVTSLMETIGRFQEVVKEHSKEEAQKHMERESSEEVVVKNNNTGNASSNNHIQQEKLNNISDNSRTLINRADGDELAVMNGENITNDEVNRTNNNIHRSDENGPVAIDNNGNYDNNNHFPIGYNAINIIEKGDVQPAGVITGEDEVPIADANERGERGKRGSVMSSFAKKLIVAFDIRNRSTDSITFVPTSSLFGATRVKKPIYNQKDGKIDESAFQKTFKDFENRVTIVKVTMSFVSVLCIIGIFFLLLQASVLISATKKESQPISGVQKLLAEIAVEGLCFTLALSQMVMLGYIQGYGMTKKKATIPAKKQEQAKPPNPNKEHGLFSRFKQNLSRSIGSGNENHNQNNNKKAMVHQQRQSQDKANENEPLKDDAKDTEQELQQQQGDASVPERRKLGRLSKNDNSNNNNNDGEIELFEQVVVSLGRSTSSLLRLTQKVSSKFSRSGGVGAEESDKFAPQQEGIGEGDEAVVEAPMEQDAMKEQQQQQQNELEKEKEKGDRDGEEEKS